MVNFAHLKSTQYPSCKCDVVIREELEKSHDNKIRQHCNGERWETRTFLCGTRIEWIPNFSEEEIRGECINSPKTQEKIKKKEELRGRIRALEQELNEVSRS